MWGHQQCRRQELKTEMWRYRIMLVRWAGKPQVRKSSTVDCVADRLKDVIGNISLVIVIVEEDEGRHETISSE